MSSPFATLFGWSRTDSIDDEMPDIFPVDITKKSFIETDTINIFSKILTDVVERTQGLTDAQEQLLWDNCLMSSKNEGLITLLAKAITGKNELYLVYERAAGVIRAADAEEQRKIKADYAATAKSSVGIYVSFKNYDKVDMIKLYSGLEFLTVASLSKSMNLAKAIQFKISNMRESVSIQSAAETKTQARKMAKGLGDGKDIILDAKDEIVTAMPDLTSVNSAIDFIESKRSFYLGLPESYINGVQTGGLGTTGENDTKAIERGLRAYFFSIIKPVTEALFGVTLIYKTQDFRQITQALEAIKTFELVDNKYLGYEAKKRIIEGLLDLDESENDAVEPDETETAQPQLAGQGPRMIDAPARGALQ